MHPTETRITILGAGGFLGTALTTHFSEKGFRVTCVGRSLDHLQLPRVELIAGSIELNDEVRRAISESVCVIHLFHDSRPGTPWRSAWTGGKKTIDTSLDIFEFCAEAGTRVVYVSSGGTVYGVKDSFPIVETERCDPISSYGVMKLALENYLRYFHTSAGLHATILRLSNPYGPGQTGRKGQGVVGAWIRNLAADLPIRIIGDGRVIRDYIYIDDVCSAVEKAIYHKAEFDIFNVGTGIGTSINELVEIFARHFPRPIQIQRESGRIVDVPVNILDIETAISSLDWHPTTNLEEGIVKSLDHVFAP